MKTFYSFAAAALMFSAISCGREETAPEPCSPEQLKYEQDMNTIREMGYDTSEAFAVKDGYVVEGDILLTTKHLEDFLSAPRTRHTSNGNYFVAKEYQTLYITFSGSNLTDKVLKAMDYWNENAQCNIVFDDKNWMRKISIREDVLWSNDGDVLGTPDEETLLFVSPPFATGEPGDIVINTACRYIPSDEQAMYMMLHAFGHAFGFGHTPKSPGDEGDGSYIEGTAEYDSKSIMVKESDPLSWSGFSENDIKAFKAVYPTDEPEPEPEPEPEIDPSIPWIYSQDDFGIELSVQDFSEDRPYVFQNYVKQTGDFWYYHENKQKYIRITDANGRVVALGKANESYSIPYGEYTLQYGVLVESVLCGEAKVKFWQTEPRIWTNARENETIDLAREYVLKCEFDTQSPDWATYDKEMRMVHVETGKEVALRFSGAADRWYFKFPDRGTFSVVLTVTNSKGETKTAEKTLKIPDVEDNAIYYKMFEKYVGIEYGYPKNNEAVSRFYLQFYSDAACTARITATENTIECSYILWLHSFDIHSELVSSNIQEQGTLLVPVGSSSCTMPQDLFNGVPYTLNQDVLEYQITGVRYK